MTGTGETTQGREEERCHHPPRQLPSPLSSSLLPPLLSSEIEIVERNKGRHQAGQRDVYFKPP